MEINIVLSRPPLVYSVAALCMLASFVAPAQSVDPNKVFESLAAFDQSVMADFTLVAEVVWPLNKAQPESERIHERVRATRSGSVWAYRADTDESTPAPVYEGISPDSPRIDQGEHRGAFSVVRRQCYSVLWEPGFSGMRDLSTVIIVRPDAAVTIEGSKSSGVVLTKPVEPLQEREFYITLMTSGRGYSTYLDKIDSAEILADGLIRCQGSGRYPGQTRNSCVWKLLVDPGAAYLVRDAKAFLPSGDKLIATFENEGLQLFDKGPLPVTGRFRQGDEEVRKRHFRGDGYTELAYHSLENGADQQLIADTRELLQGDYPPGTSVYDLKVDPSFSYKQ